MSSGPGEPGCDLDIIERRSGEHGLAVMLDQVVPWGRSLSEYVRMFDLSPADLQSRILDCAGGPASFNA
jgi:hypothetical protein